MGRNLFGTDSGRWLSNFCSKNRDWSVNVGNEVVR